MLIVSWWTICFASITKSCRMADEENWQKFPLWVALTEDKRFSNVLSQAPDLGFVICVLPPSAMPTSKVNRELFETHVICPVENVKGAVPASCCTAFTRFPARVQASSPR